MKLSPATGRPMPVRGFSRVVHPNPAISMWRNAFGVLVSTGLDDMQLPGQPDGVVGPTWIIAVSVTPPGAKQRRATDVEMLDVIACFGIDDGWEEDNHLNGITRDLFIPVDPAHRGVCECKLTEIVHVEDDGYTWSESTTDPCGTCQVAASLLLVGVRRPCPIHQAVTA